MATGSDRNNIFRDIDLQRLLPAGHFRIDRSGMIHEADQTGAFHLGAEISVLLKTEFMNRVAWDDRGIFAAHLRQVFDKKENQSCELRLVKKDASVFYAYIKSTALTDKNESEDLCRTTVRDISF